MEDLEETHITGKNIVGIIPVAGSDKYDFNMPWPDCLMPISSGYSLLESSVVECAWAGCKAIYIIVNDDFAPIIKKKIGDWCGDPVWAWRKFDPRPEESKRRIPIFYVPVHPKHRKRVDSLSWSIIHGALSAFKLSSRISKWFVPDKYYVSFPYSYFDPRQLRDHRRAIAGPENFYISFNGRTVKDGDFMSFTFGKEDWLNFRRVVRTGTGYRVPGTKPEENLLLPPEERWSARSFHVDKVFAPLNTNDAVELIVDNFYNIRSWEEYATFISGTRFEVIKKPKRSVLYASKSNKVAEDDEE